MSAVSRRYAKALFALAKEGNALQPAADQLNRLAVLAADAAIAPVLRSPLLSTIRRRELAETIARHLTLSDLLTRFVRLLADRRRLGDLPALNQHFQDLLDDEFGRVRITIRTAKPLDPDQEQALIATFTTLTGKQVIPSVAVDAELLGGVIVEVGGTVYDGSVRSQLDRLATELAGTASL